MELKITRISAQSAFRIILGLAVTVLALGCGSGPEDSGAFWMKGGILHRGSSPYQLRAVEAPGADASGLDFDSRVGILNRIAATGGNTAVVPVDPCPTAIEPAWVDAVSVLAEEAEKRSMAVILRVDSDCGGVETWGPRLASQMRGKGALIPWAVGERAAELTRILKAGSGSFVVIGAGSSDLQTNVLAGRGQMVYLNPERLSEQFHFVLGSDPAAQDALEARFGAAPFSLAGAADAEGFRALFDGRSWAGWKITGDPQGWGIENGAIVWKQPGGRRVRTLTRYGDFTLRLQWRVQQEGDNSGVFVRAPAAGRESRIGMEIQLLGDHGEPPHKNGTGSVYDVVAPRVNAVRPAGEWNDLQIECAGSRLKVTLNGELVQDLDLTEHPELKHRLRSGFIALQDHGDPVAFRNIRIKVAEPGS